ncbi:MAG: PHP domain-containing protein [Bryobacterales bacterium]|nr:PHP domain-containing protein [Bryobacterales bacterium]
MIDLHTHTTASDGTSHPEELVAQAARAGLELLAVTDHDTFAGVEAALDAARDSGLRLIAGVEISTSLDASARHLFEASPRDIHLLAYFPNGELTQEFKAWLRSMEESRWRRNRELLGRLVEEGITVEEEELRARGGSIAGRVHLAQILLKRRHVQSLDEAFRRYLGEQGASYVPRRSPPISEAIFRIRQAGGLSSLAHPIRFWGESWPCAERLCAWLAAAGLDALEVWHSEQTAPYSAILRELARKHHFRVTGGSDFHGGNKPGIALGTGYGNGALVPMDEIRASWEGSPLPLV